MARKLGGTTAESDGDSAEGGDTDDTPTLLGRRDYVMLGMAAVAATAGASATSTDESSRVTRGGVTFSRVVDAVDDLGMDPSGAASIAPQLRELEANTLVRFPDGRFRLDERVELELPGSLGLEAVGDAVIEAASPEIGLDVAVTDTVYYSGFTHDERSGGVRHRWRADGGIDLRDVEVRRGGTVTPDTTVASTDPASYRTIVLDPGEQRVYELSDGEAFENVLIDQRAEGAMFVITTAPGASNWTIRNVGWKGLAPTGSERIQTFLINVAGDGVIENIFLDQRDHNGGGPGSDVGAIWTYSDRHHGHIECRHNFIAGVGNNGCYDAGDGWAHMESTGTVSHEYSYHRDNTPSNFRPGKTGSVVRNCVAVANDPDGLRGGYPATGSQLTRACWAWHNPDIRLENCAIWWDPADVAPSAPFWATVRSRSESANCSLRVIDCDINASWSEANSLSHGSGDVIFENLGNDPGVGVLGEGVPLSPEMAARGERALPPELGTAPGGGHDPAEATAPSSTESWSYDRASGVHTDLPHELVIEHVDPGERVTYEIEVVGEIEPGEFEYPPTVDGSVARGAVGPDRGLDNLYYDGQITGLEGENLDRVRIARADPQSREIVEEIDPATVGQRTTLERTIRIVPTGEVGHYDITVSEELRDDPETDFDAAGNISGRNAEGTVSEQAHGFRFAGELTDFNLNGDVELRVDGEVIEATGGTPRTLIRFDGVGQSGVARYHLEASGTVEYASSFSSKRDRRWDLPWTRVDDGTVTGSLVDRIDAYHFDGNLLSLHVEGPADVHLERD